MSISWLVHSALRCPRHELLRGDHDGGVYSFSFLVERLIKPRIQLVVVAEMIVEVVVVVVVVVNARQCNDCFLPAKNVPGDGKHIHLV